MIRLTAKRPWRPPAEFARGWGSYLDAVNPHPPRIMVVRQRRVQPNKHRRRRRHAGT